MLKLTLPLGEEEFSWELPSDSEVVSTAKGSDGTHYLYAKKASGPKITRYFKMVQGGGLIQPGEASQLGELFNGKYIDTLNVRDRLFYHIIELSPSA